MIKALTKFTIAILFCSCATQKDIATVESATGTSAEIDRGTFPFIGEELYYTAMHSNSGAQIADLSLRVGEINEEKGVIPIKAIAKSKSLVRLFARIDDTAEVFIDAKTWKSKYATKYLDENNKQRSYAVWFWHDDLRATAERTYKGEVIRREFSLPANTMDSLAMTYEIRLMPLKKNYHFELYSFDGWIVNLFKGEVKDIEDVWTASGFVRCYKIRIDRYKYTTASPYGALSGTFIDPHLIPGKKEKGVATVWLAADEYKTPIKIEADTVLGKFEVLINE